MVKMVPTMGVTVVRDGQRVKPTIGKSFDFTVEERDALLKAQPNCLRKPVDEDVGGAATPASNLTTAAATSVTGEASVGPSAEASQAKAKAGTKKPTAGKSDKEVADEAKSDDDKGDKDGDGEAGDDDL